MRFLTTNEKYDIKAKHNYSANESEDLRLDIQIQDRHICPDGSVQASKTSPEMKMKAGVRANAKSKLLASDHHFLLTALSEPPMLIGLVSTTGEQLNSCIIIKVSFEDVQTLAGWQIHEMLLLRAMIHQSP